MFPSVFGVAVAADLLDETALDHPVETRFHSGLTDTGSIDRISPLEIGFSYITKISKITSGSFRICIRNDA